MDDWKNGRNTYRPGGEERVCYRGMGKTRFCLRGIAQFAERQAFEKSPHPILGMALEKKAKRVALSMSD